MYKALSFMIFSFYKTDDCHSPSGLAMTD